jgi:isopenicillin N synthase-like dioxygenase
MAGLPTVDVSALLPGGDPEGVAEVGEQMDRACATAGAFQAVGHGVAAEHLAGLEALARELFALDEAEKAEIAMVRGGRAWRGWFPLGDELTSGVPDRKEGIYFGAELGADHPRVRAGTPLHGPNLFPARPAGLRAAVLAHLDAMTELGHALCRGLGVGLGLGEGWFEEHLTSEPTTLFRIFRYPPTGTDGWGVAEHTDYGLLTILHQDRSGGLQMRTPDGWLDVEPVEGAFVCSAGDMLERLTGGRHRSVPHRVRNPAAHDRISMAFFFDPAWDASVEPLPLGGAGRDRGEPRWDGASVFDAEGTYGDYLLAKVAKVFPHLVDDVALGDG